MLLPSLIYTSLLYILFSSLFYILYVIFLCFLLFFIFILIFLCTHTYTCVMVDFLLFFFLCMVFIWDLFNCYCVTLILLLCPVIFDSTHSYTHVHVCVYVMCFYFISVTFLLLMTFAINIFFSFLNVPFVIYLLHILSTLICKCSFLVYRIII